MFPSTPLKCCFRFAGDNRHNMGWNFVFPFSFSRVNAASTWSSRMRTPAHLSEGPEQVFHAAP